MCCAIRRNKIGNNVGFPSAFTSGSANETCCRQLPVAMSVFHLRLRPLPRMIPVVASCPVPGAPPLLPLLLPPLLLAACCLLLDGCRLLLLLVLCCLLSDGGLLLVACGTSPACCLFVVCYLFAYCLLLVAFLFVARCRLLERNASAASWLQETCR